MNTRRGLSPVLSTVILVSVSIALGGFMSHLYSETAFSYVEVDAIEYSYIYSETVKDIDNVKWIIHIGIINRGTQQFEVTHIFVNEQPVEIYGLVDSDELDSTDIGSNLPENGIWLKSGESFEIKLFVGKDLFSSGTTLKVRVNMKNNISQYETVTLG